MDTKEKIKKANLVGITYSEEYVNEDAIGILASNPKKFSERFNKLRRSFPKAELLRVEDKTYDIYVVRLNEFYIEYTILDCIKETIKERNKSQCTDKEALDFIEEKIKEWI